VLAHDFKPSASWRPLLFVPRLLAQDTAKYRQKAPTYFIVAQSRNRNIGAFVAPFADSVTVSATIKNIKGDLQNFYLGICRFCVTGPS
jgi:hypothetical protein